MLQRMSSCRGSGTSYATAHDGLCLALLARQNTTIQQALLGRDADFREHGDVGGGRTANVASISACCAVLDACCWSKPVGRELGVDAPYFRPSRAQARQRAGSSTPRDTSKACLPLRGNEFVAADPAISIRI
jgi:hypothetical protein